MKLKKKINKNYLSKELSNKTGFSINFSKKILDDLIEIIVKNIKKDNFYLKNIGSFKILSKKERIGRNPKTKEKFIISQRRTISFTTSKEITKSLDKLI